MNSCKKLLLCVVLACLVLAQTNFRNSCQSNSMLPLLATGIVHLNPLDTFNAGSNKNYYQDLSTAQFQTTDVLGYGFALSGFQANCAQTFYTLVVDKVDFENQNTRMRLVINFLNPSAVGTSTVITRWNMVTFTYLVVSRNFAGAFSTIWATTAETSITSDIASRDIDQIGSEFQVEPPDDSCAVYTDPNFVFNPADCVGTAAWSQATGGSLIVHAYIMGFQWNSNRSSTQFLGASVFGVDTKASTFNSQNAELFL
jgi:hypothetical protein